jgi:hypothetical protein
MLLRIFVTWEDWSWNYRKDRGPNWQTQNSTFKEPVQLVLKQSSDWICDSSWDNYRVCSKTMNKTKLWSFAFVRFWSRKLEHYQHCYTSSFNLHVLCSKTSKPKISFNLTFVQLIFYILPSCCTVLTEASIGATSARLFSEHMKNISIV